MLTTIKIGKDIIKKEFSNLELKKLGIIENPYFTPDVKDPYYYIEDDGKISKAIWKGEERDLYRKYSHNCYCSQFSAEHEYLIIKNIAEYVDYIKKNSAKENEKEKYSLANEGGRVNKIEDITIRRESNDYRRSENKVLADSEDIFKKAIEKIGIDNFITYVYPEIDTDGEIRRLGTIHRYY